MNGSNLKTKEYGAIDILRLIFSLLIITLHALPFGAVNENSSLYIIDFIRNYLARLGVPFFFICSGYFLFRKMRYDSFNRDAVKKYILRMCKIYLIWAAFYTPLHMRKLISGTQDIGLFLRSYLPYLLIKGIYSHMWYMTSLVFGTVIIAFLISRKINPRLIFLFSFLLYVAGCLYPLNISLPEKNNPNFTRKSTLHYDSTMN